MSAPVWTSHRGYCEAATENTRESFYAARELGFHSLETDLRTSADGHLVLAHDSSLARISSEALAIEQANRATLERVTLAGGERLLFFDRFLEEFADCHWIFDIKPDLAHRTIDALLHWWYQPAWAEFFQRRVRFLFWHPDHQAYLRQYQPEAQCMARVEQCRRAGVASLLGLPGLGSIEAGVSYSLPARIAGMKLLSPAVVDRYRRAGGRVLAYLPESEADTRLALSAGVDEILTNGVIPG